MDDNWVEVELYRWQYGELPPQDDTRKKLDVPDALEAIAKAMTKTRRVTGTLGPTKFNLVQVLHAVARWFRAGVEENAAQKERIAELDAQVETLKKRHAKESETMYDYYKRGAEGDRKRIAELDARLEGIVSKVNEAEDAALIECQVAADIYVMAEMGRDNLKRQEADDCSHRLAHSSQKAMVEMKHPTYTLGEDTSEGEEED